MVSNLSPNTLVHQQAHTNAVLGSLTHVNDGVIRVSMQHDEIARVALAPDQELEDVGRDSPLKAAGFGEPFGAEDQLQQLQEQIFT